MALKPWPELAPNECVAHAEVRDAVERGELLWRTGRETYPISTHPTLGADHVVYSRADFEEHVKHVDMTNSGILPGELMSKAEMTAWRDLTPPDPVEPVLPGSFIAVHDVAACPMRRVVLTWTADPVMGPLLLEHKDPFGTWYELDAIAAGVEEYVHSHPGPHSGPNEYQIRYSAETEYAAAAVDVTCPI